MSDKFKYPKLYEPNEWLYGVFDEKKPDYQILVIDKPSGVTMRLVHFSHKHPRRVIAEISSMSFSDAREAVYKKYLEEMERINAEANQSQLPPDSEVDEAVRDQ